MGLLQPTCFCQVAKTEGSRRRRYGNYYTCAAAWAKRGGHRRRRSQRARRAGIPNKLVLFLIDQTESRNALATIRMFVVHPAEALALIVASTLLRRNKRFSPFLGVRMSAHGGVKGSF
jgi:hypothetical protein